MPENQTTERSIYTPLSETTTTEGKRCLAIELPIPLPTWNRILYMQPFQRKRLRDLLHQYVFIFTASDPASWTPMDSHAKPCSMELLNAEYLDLIRPSASSKSRLASLRLQRASQKKP